MPRPLRTPLPLHRPRRAQGPQRGHDIVWLFCLDSSVHDCSGHIFTSIDRSMSAAMSDLLGVDWAEAAALRHAYWSRYGATAIGLARQHGIHPDEVLKACDRFDVRP